MAHIKLKHLVENKNASLANKQIEEQMYKELAEAFEHDIKRLEETLIAEGFGDVWNKIKQKGSEMAQGAKTAILKPLLKVIVDKIAKSDPQGMAKLVNAAKTNPKSIGNLMNSPQVQAKQKEVAQQLKSVQEVLTEDEHEELFQEYVDTILAEAKVLSNDPRNVKRRELAAQRRQAKAGATAPTPATAPAAKPAKKGKGVVNKGNVAPKNGNVPKGEDPAQDKGGEEKGKPQGLVQKVYAFAKQYPKISAVVGVALLGVVAAAVVGSGGVVPLIVSTLSSAGTGAMYGGIGGAAIAGGKEAVGQYFGQGGKGKMDWRKVGQAALQGGKTGAVSGAVGGALGNVGGKAITGVGKIASWASNAIGTAHAAKNAAGKVQPQQAQAAANQGGQNAATAASAATLKQANTTVDGFLKGIDDIQKQGLSYGEGRASNLMNQALGGKAANLDYALEAYAEQNGGISTYNYMKFAKDIANKTQKEGEQAAKKWATDVLVQGQKILAARRY